MCGAIEMKENTSDLTLTNDNILSKVKYAAYDYYDYDSTIDYDYDYMIWYYQWIQG